MEPEQSFIQALLPYLLVAAVIGVAIAVLLLLLALRRLAAQPQEAAAEGDAALGDGGAAPAAAGTAVAVRPADPRPPDAAALGRAAPDLDGAFRDALRDLRILAPGPDCRYSVPWVLLLGEAGAGKSVLAANMNLALPRGEPSRLDRGCVFWFYDNGVVLDLAGDILTGRSAAALADWRRFRRLLVRHRPEQPVNAVILAVSAEEMLRPRLPDDRSLATKAALYYQRLSELQLATGLRLPVYLLLTKCDTLPGFPDLVRSLSGPARDGMLGWSNPAAADAAYTGGWIDEAFAGLQQDFERLRLEVFVERGGDVADGDGLFLLPDWVASLAGPVRQLTNTLFRDTGYRESFILRGLYLTGDAGGEAPAVPAAPPGRLPARLSAASRTIRHRPPAGRTSPQPVFLRDLLARKIFPEHGLARPTGLTHTTRNRAIAAVQLAMAVTGLLGMLFLWTGGQQLAYLQNSLLPVITSLKTALDESRRQIPSSSRTSNEAAITAASSRLERSTRLLLNGMSHVPNDWRIQLFPSYWLTDLYENIHQALVLAFNNIIFEGIRAALERRFHDITGPTTSPPASPLVPGIEPVLNQPEYFRLRQLIRDLATWEENYAAYEAVSGTSDDLHKLAGLIRYLFERELPEDMFLGARLYRGALSEARGRRLDFDHLREQTTTAIRNANQNLQTRIAQSGGVADALERLQQQLQTLHQGLSASWGARGTASRTAAPGLDVYRAAATEFAHVHAVLASPEAAWLGAADVALGSDFLQLLGIAAGMRTLNPSLPDQLQRSVTDTVNRTRARLAGIETRLTGPLLGRDGDPPHPVLALSSRAQAFEEALKDWLERPFMRDTPQPHPLNRGNRLRWNSARLGTAVALADNYAQFTSTMLPTSPAPVGPAVRELALAQFRTSLMDDIALAQEIPPVGGLSTRLRAEEDLHDAVNNFRGAAPALIHLIEVLTQLEQFDLAGQLADLVVAQGQTMLTDVDTLLYANSLYLPLNRTLWNWDGGTGLPLAMFGAGSPQDLARYAAGQRNQIKMLADSFAQPLVEILNQPAVARAHARPEVALRWNAILDALNPDALARPDGSVALLEKLITEGLDQITLDNCLQRIPAGGLPGGAAQNFFDARHAELLRTVRDRCAALQRGRVRERYARVQTAFNQLLAGRFPFSGDRGLRSDPQADLPSLAAFFRTYDTENVPGLLEVLQGLDGRDAASDQAIQFLSQLAGVRTFLAAYLQGEPPGGGPGFELEVEFRANRAGERRANEIIEWAVDTGAARAPRPDAGNRVTWGYGLPLSIALRWASNALSMPDIDPTQPELRIEGGTAIFALDSPWSLIALLHRYRVASEDRPHLLRLRVPLRAAVPPPGTVLAATPPTPGSTEPNAAVVFLRIGVRSVPQPGGSDTTGTAAGAAAIRPLVLPAFPTTAPPLP